MSQNRLTARRASNAVACGVPLNDLFVTDVVKVLTDMIGEDHQELSFSRCFFQS